MGSKNLISQWARTITSPVTAALLIFGSATACQSPESVERIRLASGDDELAPIPAVAMPESFSNIGKLRLSVAQDAEQPLALFAAEEEKPVRPGFADLAKAEISFSSIEVRAVEGNFYRYVFPQVTVDLLHLDEALGQIVLKARIPAGEYDLIRFITDGPGVATFLDGSAVPFEIPSGENTGLKVFFEPAFAIAGEQLTEATIKTAPKQSFVFPGAGKVLFKPVLRAVWLEPAPVPQPTPSPTESSEPGEPGVPGDSGNPADPSDPGTTPDPNATPSPTESPDPNVTPSPTESPDPNVTPSPTESPDPNVTPSPTESPDPNATPSPTESPDPGATPSPTPTTPPDDFIYWVGV